MPWFIVDDQFGEHPKLEQLEGEPLRYMAAVTVWTVMGADCANRLTDGVVTLRRLEKKLGHLKKHALIGAESLVSIGLWERHPDGFVFHDWAEYQPTKSEVELKRKQKTERQRRWRDARVDASTGASRVAPVAPAHARVSHPIPSHPIPENPPIPPGGGELVELRDADREAIRPSAGGAYLAEVREAWAEAWHAADAGVVPRLAPALMAGAVAFARDVASAHKLPLRDAARAVAEAALRAGGDPTWHLTRLDPFAAPRPLPGAGNGTPEGRVRAAEAEVQAALDRRAPPHELRAVTAKLEEAKSARDAAQQREARYARR